MESDKKPTLPSKPKPRSPGRCKIYRCVCGWRGKVFVSVTGEVSAPTYPLSNCPRCGKDVPRKFAKPVPKTPAGPAGPEPKD